MKKRSVVAIIFGVIAVVVGIVDVIYCVKYLTSDTPGDVGPCVLLMLASLVSSCISSSISLYNSRKLKEQELKEK